VKRTVASAIVAVLAFCAAGAATADTYYQKTTVTTDDSDQDPWCRSNIWTNSAGAAYTITATGANSDPNTFVVSPGMELHAKMGKDVESVFPGETLVISAKGSSAGFLRPRQKTLTIPNLILDGEEMTSDILTFIDNNGVGSSQPDLVTTITGTNLTIKTPSDKWVLINGAGGEWSQHTKIDSPLSGSGNLLLNGQWAKAVTTYKNFYLTGDNSKFTGKLMLRGNSSTTPNARLYVSAANQLGGNPETPQFDGIQLVRSSSLWFTDSMKIDLPNRGIYFNCYDGSTDRGKITVDEGCDVEYTGPWSFPGTDKKYWPFKYGKGRLYFSGGCFPGKSTGGFYVIQGILKFPAQHIVADSTALRIAQEGTNPYKIVEFGSNGVARVNPTYFTFSSTLAIVDTATLEVTSANKPAAVTNITIASQATLSMAGTAAVALNNVTLEDGATLAYHFSSTNTTSVPNLSINSGKALSLPGTIKVRITADEGLYFNSVGNSEAGYELTTGYSLPDDAVTSGKIQFADGKPSWARCLAIEGGNLKLYPYGPGLTLSVR
jgi:hypothetical protein